MTVILLFVLVTKCICHAEIIVTFEGDLVINNDQGYATLAWETEHKPVPSLDFELQRGRSPEFAQPALIYQGNDRASVISGLSEGTTWYRVRALQNKKPAGPWSPALSVEVKYPSAGFVAGWMIVGAVVFIATLVVIIGGHFLTRNNAIA